MSNEDADLLVKIRRANEGMLLAGLLPKGELAAALYDAMPGSNQPTSEFIDSALRKEVTHV